MTTPGLAPEQIAEAIHLAGDTVSIDRVAGFDIVDTWERERSGNRFYRFRVDPDGREVVVKTGDDWTAGEARAASEAQTRLADALTPNDIGAAGVLRPYGWVETPPLLVMPYVDGTDLVTLLRDPTRGEWEHMTAWITAAGAMLARFHQASPASAPPGVLDEIEGVVRKLRLPRSLPGRMTAAVAWEERCAAGYGDFGPGNLIGSSDGLVYLIDPPTDPETALIHRDLGNFLFEMRRQLAGHGYTRSRPVPGRFDDLRQALLAGYASRSPHGPLGPADEALIALFEARRASGMARKRLPGRPGDALWFARSARARRRQVKRLAAQLA